MAKSSLWKSLFWLMVPWCQGRRSGMEGDGRSMFYSHPGSRGRAAHHEDPTSAASFLLTAPPPRIPRTSPGSTSNQRPNTQMCDYVRDVAQSNQHKCILLPMGSSRAKESNLWVHTVPVLTEVCRVQHLEDSELIRSIWIILFQRMITWTVVL